MDTDLAEYLREINKIDLLTAEQEIELATTIRNGASKTSRDAARDRMIQANLRLVVSIAKKYRHSGMSLMDLIEEGNLGLLKAVERFDPKEKRRFSTYATWWIRQTIRRSLVNTNKTVRVPSYMAEIVSKWKHAATELLHKLGHPPSMDEIARHLSIPKGNIGLVKRAINASAGTGQAISLDDLYGTTEGPADERAAQPEDVLLSKDECETLKTMLDGIDEWERHILELRYGLDDREPMTLNQIGKEVNLTRERVRQIENEALRKLQFSALAKGQNRRPQ